MPAQNVPPASPDPGVTTTEPTHRSWLVTGASSGIGLALARAAADRGDDVVALARDTGPLGRLVEDHGARVLALPADVRRQADVDDAVARAVEVFGRIDVVANNAGYGVFGAVEESTDEQARGIFDTNVFGVLNVLRATLPVLRAQRSGHILQGSSYYGRVAHPGVGLLTATKYAVEGLTDALVGELEPFGIKELVQSGTIAIGRGARSITDRSLRALDRWSQRWAVGAGGRTRTARLKRRAGLPPPGGT